MNMSKLLLIFILLIIGCCADWNLPSNISQKIMEVQDAVFLECIKMFYVMFENNTNSDEVYELINDACSELAVKIDRLNFCQCIQKKI
jgi:hypothetical protein